MNLHSLIIGDGDKHLIVLHGFLGMGNNWKSYALGWSQLGFKVHLIDQRNHGRSFWSDEFDYKILSDDIFKYMRDLKISSSIIIGHSMGGKTAMNFALNHQKMITKLIIVDISPRKYVQNNQDILDGLGSMDFGLIKSRKEAHKHLLSKVPEIEFRNFLLKNLYWNNSNSLSLRLNINVLKKSSSIYESVSSHNSFKGPVLFIKGDMSDYIIDEDKSLIINLFPRAKIQIIKNAGHWVHVENKIDFNTVVQNFLKL